MNNWIPKNKIVSSALSILLISISLYFWGLFFINKKVSKVENYYRDTESEYSKEGKRLALKSVVKINEEEIQILRNFFIQKGDEIKFIKEIEEAARGQSVQLEIASINIKTQAKNDFKEEVIIKINIEGTWLDIFNFLGVLERLPFGILVQNMNLDANVPKKWTGSINLVVFREN